MPHKGTSKELAPINGRLSFLAPESCKLAEDVVVKARGPARPLPSSGTEWLQLAIQLLSVTHEETQRRAIDVCAEAAAVLLDEAARKDEAAARARRAAAQQSAGSGIRRRPAPPHGDDEDEDEGQQQEDFSPREGSAVGSTATSAAPPALERVEAAHVLVAGALAALALPSADGVSRAVALAKQAARAAPSAMASVTLAWSWYRVSRQLPERGAQDAALGAAAASAASAASALLAKDPLGRDDEAWLARTAWVLAALGESEAAQLCVSRLLSASPTHRTGLLLLALLHSADGNTTSAMSATVRLMLAHPGDIAGGLLLAVLRLAAGETEGGASPGPRTGSHSRSSSPAAPAETLAEELAVAMARVEAFAAAATAGDGFARKRSLKSFCLHPAPGEDVLGAGTVATRGGDGEGLSPTSGTASLTVAEARRRAGHYWAFLSHVCVRAGAVGLAEVAVEAGLAFVASAKGSLHRCAFANLLCCRARLALQRLTGRIAPGAFMSNGGELRELNLLGTILPSTSASPVCSAASAATASLLALRAEVRGVAGEVRGAANAMLGGSAQEPLSDASRLLDPRSLAAIFTYLVKAEEVCPDHGEARYLMGVVRLLESSQPDLPRKEREQKRAFAVQFFTEALRMSPGWADPHLGLACVMESQGATEAAVDVYASAAELSLCEPIIAYERLLFQFE